MIRWLKNGLAGVVGIVSLAYFVHLEFSERAAPEAPARTTDPVRPHTRGSKLRIGWTAWADAEIVTTLTARLIETHFDRDVELVMADIGVQYQGVATGSIDLMMMAWLPNTHRTYWEKVATDVIDLGPIYTGARIGWAVPAYVPANELKSIADLSTPEVRRRLSAQVQGIDPGAGLMVASERALQVYGLESYGLVSASGAAMTAALDRALRSNEWIVVTAWSPHWIFARWELRYLDDPEVVFGGPESVHVVTRTGFARDHGSELVGFLSRLSIPLPRLEAMMLEASETSAAAVVDRFVQQETETIDYWLRGEVRRQPN